MINDLCGAIQQTLHLFCVWGSECVCLIFSEFLCVCVSFYTIFSMCKRCFLKFVPVAALIQTQSACYVWYKEPDADQDQAKS